MIPWTQSSNDNHLPNQSRMESPGGRWGRAEAPGTLASVIPACFCSVSFYVNLIKSQPERVTPSPLFEPSDPRLLACPSPPEPLVRSKGLPGGRCPPPTSHPGLCPSCTAQTPVPQWGLGSRGSCGPRPVAASFLSGSRLRCGPPPPFPVVLGRRLSESDTASLQPRQPHRSLCAHRVTAGR